MGPALRIAVVVVLIAVIYVGITAVQVYAAGRRDERAPADAVVVLGAAQYDGRPSPVFQARLDHALALYAERVAPQVVVTGGKQASDRVTEAFTAYDYLRDRGVPDDALLVVTDGRDTWESLAATARVLDERGLRRVVLVSDPTHALRTQVIAESLGLHAQVSPTDTSPAGSATRLRQTARETVAVALGRIVGHRRLANLGALVATATATPAGARPSYSAVASGSGTDAATSEGPRAARTPSATRNALLAAGTPA